MRTPITVATGLTAVAALAAAALVLLPHQAAGRADPAPSVTAIDHPEPVTLPTGAVAVGDGAHRSGPAGLPLGFAHDTNGALAAGTAWLTIVEGLGVLDPARRAVILGAIGEPAFVTAAGRRLAARRARLGRPGGGYLSAVVRPERGAYKVLSAAADAVRLEVWYPYQLGVVAAGAQPGPAHWQRAWLPLRWDAAAADWRLSADLSFESGPDPRDQQPSLIARTEALQAYGTGWHVYPGTQE